jgi:hypothetical protein
MPIDRELVDELVDRQIEAIEAECGENVNLDGAVVLIAVRQKGTVNLRSRSTSDPFRTLGFLRMAEQAVCRRIGSSS